LECIGWAIVIWSVGLAVLSRGALGLTPAGAAEAPASITGEQLKAAFFVNVVVFCEWPAERFSDATAPLLIGVYGTDPFGPALEFLAKKKLAGMRKIEVRKITRDEEALRCHALFFPAETNPAAGEKLAVFLNQCTAAGILTVGDASGFLKTGGMVGLRLDPNAVERNAASLSLQIDRARAEQAKLRLSAKLLDLARKGSKPSERSANQDAERVSAGAKPLDEDLRR